MKATEMIRGFQKSWFLEIHPFLLPRNLNVGSGHGYFSQIADEAGIEMTSLEVSFPEDVINPEKVILYDGKVMPFKSRSFDAGIAMYVLHHTPHPEALLEEMKRVSAKRIILVEEVYRNFFGKVQLAAFDFWVNARAGLKSEIHWNSYLSSERFERLCESGGWSVVHKTSKPQRGFELVLVVLDRKD